MHSSRMRTICSRGHISGGGGVPAWRAGGCTCRGVYLLRGCTWSEGVYLPGGDVYLPEVHLVWGVYLTRRGCTCWGVPGLGGTWSRGVYLPGGIPAQGGVPVRGVPGPEGCIWSGGCTWLQGVHLVRYSPLWTDTRL